jgi:hypothetical protein
MGRARLLIILCLLTIWLTGYTTAALANKWEVFGGAELTNQEEDVQYIAVGLIQPIKEDWWLLGRVMGLNVDYKFDVDDDTLEGKLSSATPSLGIRRSLGGGSVSLLGGLDIEWIEQEEQNGTDDKDQKMGVSIQGEWDKWWPGANNLSCIVNYKSIDNFFWGRLRGKKGVGQIGRGNIFLGAEMVGMGNDDFAAYQAGLIAEAADILPALSLGLRAGYKHSSSFTDAIYGGIEFYYSY